MTELKCVACTKCTSKSGKDYYKVVVTLPNGSSKDMISSFDILPGETVNYELRSQYIKVPSVQLVAVISQK